MNAGNTKIFGRRGRRGCAENAEEENSGKKISMSFLCVLCESFAPSAFKLS
jgi:hypothetical protein